MGNASRETIKETTTLKNRFSIQEALDAVAGFPKSMSEGYKGDEVKSLQQLLTSFGYFQHPRITHNFGPKTKIAVIAFQKENGVISNEKSPGAGVVGPKTKEALINKIRERGIIPEDVKDKDATVRDKANGFHDKVSETMGAIIGDGKEGIFLEDDDFIVLGKDEERGPPKREHTPPPIPADAKRPKPRELSLERREQLIAKFKVQYDEFHGQKPAWEKVRKSLTAEVLTRAAYLKEAVLFSFSERHEALFADGTPEVPEETLGMDYREARTHCEDLGLKMFTENEYREFQSGSKKYEAKGKSTWLDSGANTYFPDCACWFESGVKIEQEIYKHTNENLGVRRLLRVACV
ncbi:MAG: peptidoglycan-binding domain-containing protein [Patescibacteria group bacterium]